MGTQEDHDLLIEIRSDVKHIKQWTEAHEKSDNDRFNKILNDVEFHKKIIYGIGGIVFFIQVISRIIKF